ncbi:hypothetical protein C8A05DRAFT_31814 [Staphylotrichum tortipilum]|uniref:Protein kinase domain-containing protein n=1 Tax=Staphylotrichum tortipilum TaxID=2831512 RepID=A0AAN6RVD3_9PEZI|nr:hypothetical protein C8A05DRAFT_31814 [Staphylotrichum longicolle]
MASIDALSQTLASITAIKLDQLQKQKDAYESKKRSLCEEVASETDTAKRAKKLLKGAREIGVLGHKNSEGMDELDEFFDQAEYDSSVTESMLNQYEAQIHGRLQVQTNKYDFASLYGKLVNEWIEAGSSDAGADAGGSPFVVVGREEMHQQRATWEEYVFKAKETDGQAIKAYLEDVFSSKEAKKALGVVREKIERFQKKEWNERQHFSGDTLPSLFKAMLRSDMLTEEKRTTLRGFMENKVVLSEIADVLNMRMTTLESWTWGTPLIVEQRRHLNGRYRFLTDEDLLHSILIYYVGLQWASQFRQLLGVFVDTESVWQPGTNPISKDDMLRRRFFFADNATLRSDSVEANRDEHFRSILLDQLPTSVGEIRASYGSDGCERGDTKPSHVRVVQGLLQRLQADILVQTKLGSDMTVIRSDFKWFGPSVPHSTIFAVLEFFGVDERWRDFFRRVLEATMQFKNDPADSPARTRKRGTLINTPVADFMTESILFCLDYAVNQKAGGTRLYRLHDDTWLWGGAEACSQAWGVMTAFTDIMGLELNMEKTGCVRIAKVGGGDEDAAAPDTLTLPTGDIKWGFLRLDPATGRFLINQGEVDKHIEELRLQLSACRSVLDYIQAWNIYGHRFFSNNFGLPAHCYGRAHIDSMLATFARIQQQLFPSLPGGVGAHLKNMIATRFGGDADSIPDGYLYWPASLGGLGLKNPFIAPLLSRRDAEPDPAALIDTFLADEELDYDRARSHFKSGTTPVSAALADRWGNAYSSGGSSSSLGGRGGTPRREFAHLADQPFPDLEEFGRFRVRTSSALGSVYARLMREPDVAVLSAGRAADGLDMGRAWHALSPYEKWVLRLYHEDMVERFGGVEVVDKGVLPAGLLEMVRGSRFSDGHKQKYLALKVLSADSYGGPKSIFEREILTHLRDGDKSHLGYNYICHLLNDLSIRAPTATTFGAMFDDSMIPYPLMRRFAAQLLAAVDYAHKHCVIHTDIKPDNIFLKFLSRTLIPSYITTHPPPPQDRTSTSYTPLPSTPLDSYYSPPSTSDLPLTLRAPEVLIKASWDEKVDWWNVGALLLELYRAVRMFDGRVPPDGHYAVAEHVAEIVDLFGELPGGLVERGGKR